MPHNKHISTVFNFSNLNLRRQTQNFAAMFGETAHHAATVQKKIYRRPPACGILLHQWILQLTARCCTDFAMICSVLQWHLTVVKRLLTYLKWLEIDQDNRRIKFSARNVDFSSPSPDPLDSSRPAHMSVKEGYPCKKWLFILCWLQIGTAMLLIITSTDDELLTNVNIDDLEWPWTLKILILNDFLAIFSCKRVNCNEMDGDKLRLPANRNCYRLSRTSWALAQISCNWYSTRVT